MPEQDNMLKIELKTSPRVPIQRPRFVESQMNLAIDFQQRYMLQ